MTGRSPSGPSWADLRPALLQTLAAVEASLEASHAEALVVREALVGLDAERLLGEVVRRGNLNDDLAEARRALARRLDEAGAALGMEAPTLEALGRVLQGRDPEVVEGVSRVRRLASELARADDTNRRLGERGLRILAAYLAALRPEAASYDRRGRRLGERLEGATSSRHA